MKKKLPPVWIASAFVLSAISFTACEEVLDAIPPFDFETENINFTIPIVTQVGTETELTTQSSNNEIDEVLSDNNVPLDANELESIKATEIRVNLSDADNSNNLANFQELKIYFGVPGSGQTLLATQAISNSFSNNITIPISNSPELKSYFNAASLVFTVRGTARTATTKTLSAVMRVEFLVVP